MIPRVVLALDRPTLQRQLHKRLAASGDLIVDVLQGKQRLWERLKREICDLVVVSESRVPAPAAEMIELMGEVPDAPAIVVVLHDPGPELQAQLMAAGCKAVLDAETSTEAMADVLETVLAQQRESVQQRLAANPLAQPQLRDFVSNSPVMQAFLEVVQRVVTSTVSILILGETGVGKERLARAIHQDSPRSGGPFVAVNCGALPETLLESELFGHEEGAFTGATRSRRGYFEMAHGGTVFLDEIGELPQHLQVKLLRVLQDREVRRIGGERSITVDVRIMTATNRDLDTLVAEGLFRRDLFYRLNVMTLTLPPLRERREDVRELVLNYIGYLGPRIGCEVDGIEASALAALCAYEWPGNVRELINVVERAMLLCRGSKISLAELPVGISETVPSGGQRRSALPAPGGELPPEWLDRPWRDVREELLGELERAYLAGLLAQTGGRIGETAHLAGMQPRSLFQKMRRHGLHKEDYRRRSR